MCDINNVKDKQGHFVVFSYRVYNEKYQTEYQYIPICPFCGGSHLHGISEGGTGIREPHCVEKPTGRYRLFCLGEMPALIKRHFEKRFNWEDV
ncbi:hypothetical protein A11S_2091 [Micavibrio aeruginosavorus EPB]|uniref:Uncharacterized protein n=1 Tax=Micavibrio aeruginosavorus EPB TaxID=349215 RepID=M4VK63_9BACT|nr:hypothetical protein A11S_2091 [Micavibrio aeruginosavorus EPB]